MGIALQLISGVMFGIEVLWEEKGLVLDLGIIRVIFFLGVSNDD